MILNPKYEFIWKYLLSNKMATMQIFIEMLQG